MSMKLIDEVKQIFSSMTSAKEIILKTSGTTGTPKDVVINLENAIDNKKGRGDNEDVWLLTYSPQRWAGLSVLIHVHKTGAQLLVPDSLDPYDIIKLMYATTHISLTPSLFRKLLLINTDVVMAAPIKQLTFGGEYATQKILDDAQHMYPTARITHVYASTEFGDICAASDCLEGYPFTKIIEHDGYVHPETKELFLKGRATGDLWDMKNDRLYFVGRQGDIVNVGGAKVNLLVVEKEVGKVLEVKHCRAFAISNPLLGQVIGLEYVGDITPIALKKLLLQALPKYAVPVQIKQVDEISLTAAGKVSRI